MDNNKWINWRSPLTWVVLLGALLVGRALPVPDVVKPAPVETLKDLQKKLLREHPSWHFIYIFDEENKPTGFWIVTNDAYSRICNQMRVTDYLETLEVSTDNASWDGIALLVNYSSTLRTYSARGDQRIISHLSIE